jgi:ATP adenylyltransferase
MKQLWAPWRMDYILGSKSGKCIFCHSAHTRPNKKKLILHCGEFSLVMLNRYPYTNGHLLVAPRKHTDALDILTPEAALDLVVTLSTSIRLLKEALKTDGFNIGMNLGRVAGAGVEDHLHFHIVPRWRGDTNFMPILAETSVIPEHLEKAYEKLIPFFKKF